MANITPIMINTSTTISNCFSTINSQNKNHWVSSKIKDTTLYELNLINGNKLKIIKRQFSDCHFSRYFIAEFYIDGSYKQMEYLDYANDNIENNEEKILDEVKTILFTIQTQIEERDIYIEHKKDYVKKHGKSGWYGEKIRHSLARRKIKSIK